MFVPVDEARTQLLLSSFFAIVGAKLYIVSLVGGKCRSVGSSI